MPSITRMHTNRVSFDKDWICHEGEFVDLPKRIVGKGSGTCYASELTEDETPETCDFNMLATQAGPDGQVDYVKLKTIDSTWYPVTLPHDWRIKKTVAKDHPVVRGYPSSYQGFYPTGIAYYRKRFSRTLASPDERVHLTFEGVVGRSDFWINGFWLGSNATAYSPVSFDVTEFLRDDEQGGNVVLVKTDNAEAEGWWYEGGGISRHTWLESHHALHVVRDGVFITTPKVSPESAEVSLSIELKNDGSDTYEQDSVLVSVQILNDSNIVVAEQQIPTHRLSSLQQESIHLGLQIDTPKLWNIGRGNLYIARISLQAGGEAVFTQDYTFGVRRLDFVQDGILINGEWHKIFGTNIHTDSAAVGVAVPDRMLEAKLELLREMGTNTVRTAHHAPTPELVYHADRLGMLILPENRLLSTAPHQIGYLHKLIRQFRSHPSILLWSMENEEVGLQGTKLGANILRRLVQETKALDPTRVTSSGGVSRVGSDYYKETDIVGIHYQSLFNTVESAVDRIKDKIYIQDECGTLLPSSRGVYHEDDDVAGHNSAFLGIVELMPMLGMIAQLPIMGSGDIKAKDNIARCQTEVFRSPLTTGGCVWTGMDYHGEPIPNVWPAVISPYGARDLVGLPKDYYWLLRALFRKEACVHAFPHWTWPGYEGKKIPFRVYSNSERVEVFVNGKSVATASVESTAAYFPDGVTYKPGALVVKGFVGDKVVAEHRQVTAGVAHHLELIPDRGQLCTDGRDVATVRVAVVDADGTLVPSASNLITFQVKGVATIIGVGNGDNATTESAQDHVRHAFRGYAAVYVLAGSQPGSFELVAMADGLESATLSFSLDAELEPNQVYTARDEAISPAGVHVMY